MERTLASYILKDLDRKIVLLMSPRQCGKTTLAKQLAANYDYLSYDLEEDRASLKSKRWRRNTDLVIFDELHKMPSWKRWLKGVYDTEGIPPKLMVTGRAKLNTYRKVGDSLAGRYFQYHLHPIDIKEACYVWQNDPNAAFDRIMQFSGFPEPFLAGEKTFYDRWRKTHIDVILRQDLLDVHSTRNIQSIEILVQLLKQRVGSTVSYSNLARDLETDIHTVKRWLSWLEDLYIIFKVSPYHKNISRSILKESKYYFYDVAQVQANDGAKLENLVACSLLKELHFLEDTQGIDFSIHFLRTKEGKELDFAIMINNKFSHLIEVKWSDNNYVKAFDVFSKFIPEAKKIHLVYQLNRESSYPNGVQLLKATNWLANIDLSASVPPFTS